MGMGDSLLLPEPTIMKFFLLMAAVALATAAFNDADDDVEPFYEFVQSSTQRDRVAGYYLMEDKRAGAGGRTIRPNPPTPAECGRICSDPSDPKYLKRGKCVGFVWKENKKKCTLKRNVSKCQGEEINSEQEGEFLYISDGYYHSEYADERCE